MRVAAYINQKAFDLNREDRKKGIRFFPSIKPSGDKLHCDPRCEMWRGDYCWVNGFLKTDKHTGEHIRAGDCFTDGEKSEGLNKIAEATSSKNPKDKMYIGYGLIVEGFFENYNFDKGKITEHFNGLNKVFVQNDYIRWLQSEYRNAKVFPNMDVFEKDNCEKEMKLFFKPFKDEMDNNWPLSPEPSFETMGFDIGRVFRHASSFNSENPINYFEWVIKEAEIAKSKKAPESENINDYIEMLEKFQKAIRAELEYRRKWMEFDKFGEKESNERGKTNEEETFPERILWIGSHTQLVYHINRLQNDGFLSKALDCVSIIEKHFCNEKGEPFKNSSQVFQNVFKTNSNKCPRNAKILDQINEDTKKQK